MSDLFPKYIARIVNLEGGLTLDRNDTGNWTGGQVGVGELKGSKFGISAASYPKLDIANLTKEDAIALYRRDYWEPIHGDSIPPAAAYAALDGAINSGVARSLSWLQRAAGVMGDGVWGRVTDAAVRVAEPAALALKYTSLRMSFMASASGWRYYSGGWMNRMAKNVLYLAEDIKE